MTRSAEQSLWFTVDSCQLPSGVIKKERSFIRNNDLLGDGTGIS